MLIYEFWQAKIIKGKPRQPQLAKMHMYVLWQANMSKGKPRQPLLAKMLIYGHRRAKII